MKKKDLMDLVLFLESKGNLYQKEKTHFMFNSRAAKENGKRFRAECNRRMEKMFRSLGVSSLDDIIRQTEENVRKSKTCRLCGFYCTNYHTLEIHRNSQRCKRRQAEKKGEFLFPKNKRQNAATSATNRSCFTTGEGIWNLLLTKKTFAK